MGDQPPTSAITGIGERIFQSAPVAIVAIDENGHVTAWNAGAENLLGWRADEVLGKPNPALPIRPLSAFKRKVGAITRGKPSIRFESQLKNISGDELILDVHISSLAGEQGEISGYLLIMVDWTESRRSQQDIIELLSQWQTTFNAVTDAICLLDKNSRIIQCNDAMLRMFGVDAKKIAGKYCWRVVHGTTKPIPDCPITRMNDSLHREKSEIQRGDRWLDITVDPILSGNRTLLGSIYILRDITQQKKIEQALIRIAGTLSNGGKSDFFAALVSSMCQTLEADIGFVVEPCQETRSMQTIAAWMDGEPAASIAFDLEDSPCLIIASQQMCCYPENFREQFPNDSLLSQMAANGFIGIPLLDSQKQFLGILVALYRQPIPNPELTQTLIQLYANRASAELERLRGLEKLRGTEQRLRDIVEHSTNLFYSYTPDLQLTYVSPQSRAFFGCEPEDALIRWTDFMSDQPVNQQGYAKAQRAIDTGQAQPPYELELKTRDGRTLWVQVNEAPIVDEGKTIAIVGSLTDITESKKAQVTSQQSETSYRGLFNYVDEGIYIQDKDGHFLDVNRGSVWMSGYPREYLVGRRLEDIAAPGKNDMQQVYDMLAKAFDGEPQELEFWGLRRNGIVFPEEVRLTKGTYYGQDVVIAMARDITERKRAEAALQRQLQELTLLHAAAVFAASASDEETLIRQVTDLFGNSLYSEDFGFLLLDEESGAIVQSPSYRAGESLLAEVIPPGRGITGSVLRSGKPRRVSDVSRDPEYFESFPAARSELCVPLRLGGRVIGVINTESKEENAFSEADERLLTTLAGQVAIAIEHLRIRAVEREQRIMAEALRDTAEVLGSTLDFDQVLDRILDNIDRVVPSMAASIMLVTDDTAHVIRHRGYAERGLKDWIESLVLKSSEIPSVKQMLQDRQAQLISDTQKDENWITFPATNWVRSYLSSPILQNERVIGLINLDHEIAGFYNRAHADRLDAFASQAAIAIENARLFDAEHQRREEAETLREAGAAVASTLDRQQAVEMILDQLIRVIPYDSASVQLLREGHLEIVGGRGWPDIQEVMGMRFPVPGNNPNTRVILERMPVILQVASEEYEEFLEGPHSHIKSWLGVPLIVHDRVIGMLALDGKKPNHFTKESARLATAFANQAAVAIENARLFLETQHRLTVLETVNRISTGLRAAHNVEDMLPRLVDETLSVLNTDSGVIWLYEPLSNTLHEAISRGWFKEIREQPVSPGEGIAGQVFQSGEAIISAEFADDQRTRESTRAQIPSGWGGACVPIRTMQEVIGVLFVSVRSPRQLSPEDVNLLVTISEMAGNAIRRASLFEQSERQVQRLAALRSIDMVISSMLDLHVALMTLLELIVAQLKVDAADVLLFNPNSQVLEYEAGIGFRTNAIRQTRVSLGQSLAGRAALDRTHVHLPNLKEMTGPIHQQQMIRQEDFQEYHGIPLLAKGQVVGVLEIYHRSSLANDPEWLDFLETVASEVAIEIDNARLFDGLQRSNTELSLAYERTIEGWSHALDLRDKETEGHTQRVVKLTEELARRMGLQEADIIHARRGALLHDIGKMGVPDRILHKTGPLDAEEWETMRLHPVFAYDMLSSITYLKPALDIPYCHHEWWDGSGYPRGLKGEQIPLTARIFAVIDVWDALSHDRPYRKAWQREDIIKQLIALKGKQFDSRVIEAFMKIIEAEG